MGGVGAEILGALEGVARDLNPGLGGLELRPGAGVGIGQVGDPGDVEDAAIGLEFLAVRRVRADLRGDAEALALLRLEPDHGAPVLDGGALGRKMARGRGTGDDPLAQFGDEGRAGFAHREGGDSGHDSREEETTHPRHQNRTPRPRDRYAASFLVNGYSVAPQPDTGDAGFSRPASRPASHRCAGLRAVSRFPRP